MVYANGGHVECLRQRASQRGTDQQCPHESWPGGVGNAAEVAGRQTRLVQYLVDQLRGLADVIARGQFRHHAAVLCVQVDLAVQTLGDDSARRVVDGDAGLVAGGLDAEDRPGQRSSVVGRHVAGCRLSH